ncbi:hypothetical protein [Micromonospora musae]|uniref:hypothetical protein n=1 Tax=Micromonospora musae TaxID=1894970 RepID=UPI0018F3B7FA|nr:hypothetical protein [Micromonospora musae]
MSDGREPDRLADRAEADRLLDAARAGEPAEADGPPDPLAELLAAAAAPARAHELEGEQAALAAFRAARATPTTLRAPRRRRLTAGALAWVAGLLVTATAGVAFAAVTLEQAAAPPVPVSPTPATGRPESRPAESTSTDARPDVAPSPDPERSSGGPEQDEQAVRLCAAYLAKKPAQREKALTTPSFRPLVEAAGGVGEVEAYCQEPARAGRPSPPPVPAEPGNGQGKVKDKDKDQGDDQGKVKDKGDGKGNGSGPASALPVG